MITLLAITILAAPIRVACIGDSITEGRGGMNAYPAQLQEVLGSRYQVRNFGRTSASVMPGTLQYRKLNECKEAIDFQPNIVIMMLGTNDSPGLNWSERGERFRQSYSFLIDGFKELKSKPEVIVMMPPPMFFPDADWRPKNLDNEIIPILKELAQQSNCRTYDARALFDRKPDLMPDKLHPSNMGFQIMAQDIAEKIFDKRAREMKRLDWANQVKRQTSVDKEDGQYLGHVSTVLLADNKTILAVYPNGHGKGAIIMKRSEDGGKTWSDRLPVPENWTTSLETPTIHRVGPKRLVLWSGLYPARIASSDDEGITWTPLRPVGDWGGIVVMGFVEVAKDGRTIAMFHDDGRFFAKEGKATGVFTLYQTESADLGETWSLPRAIQTSGEVHLCEPGQVRSDDGRHLAVLLRENRRKLPSHVMISMDEGKTWGEPRPMHPNLTGDRHTMRRLSDGRIVAVFRDMQEGDWKGDFVAWVGTYADLVAGRPGQLKIRLLDNQDSWDCGYPGLELFPDGTLVATTYGHWDKGKPPFIKAVRFQTKELRD